jgi:hypothetical protein
VSTSPDFSGKVFVKNSTKDQQRTMIFEGLAYSTIYYARTKSELSGYGRVTSFTTMADPNFRATTMATMVQVHPNPSATHFNLSLESTAMKSVEVTVSSLQGERIGTYQLVPDGTLQIGESFKKGIYVLRLTDGTQVRIMRVVKN